MVGSKRSRQPHRRRNAERDLEIYERVYVRRELSEEQAAAEYGLTTSGVSKVLTAEAARRGNAARARVVRYDGTTDRNAEIYRRVVELRELTANKAAGEYGVTRQRVSQILDAVHRQRYGVKRPSLRG